MNSEEQPTTSSSGGWNFTPAGASRPGALGAVPAVLPPPAGPAPSGSDAQRASRRNSGDRVRMLLRGVGQTLITLGVVVLLCIFVLIQIVAATLSFRMISLIPHHAPKLLGFSAGGRVDMDQFGRDAAMVGGIQSLRTIQASLAAGAQGGDRDNRMGHTPPPSLPAPGNGSTPPSGGGRQGMDPTLRASNDTPPQSPPPAPREERGNG